MAVQKVGGRLLTDPPPARQAVGRVAAQRDEVGDELRRHAVAFAHLVRVDDVGTSGAAAQIEHGDRVRRALEHVAVAGEDQRLAAGLGLDPRERAEHVVGLHIDGRQRGPAERVEEVRGGGELAVERVRGRLPVGVVWLVELGAVGGRLLAEAQHDGAGRTSFELEQDQVGRAEQGVHRPALAVGDRIRQGVEGAEEQRRSVDDEQRVAHRGGRHIGHTGGPLGSRSSSVTRKPCRA